MSGRTGAGGSTGSRLRSRLVIAATAAVAVALIVVLLSSGTESYTANVQMQNAGGLREGFKVRVDGVPVGKVKKVELGRSDIVTAEVTLDDATAPIGRDARATVRAVNLLGEKYLDLEPGNVDDAAPSGATIPASRTTNSIELDDVIDTLDPPTRAALSVVLNEGGRSVAGRGSDLARAVEALPSALDSTGELLDRLNADNQALGRLIESSDPVVAGLARERRDLGRMVGGAAGTLDALASRQRELATTVRDAPATLSSLQTALVALQNAAIPLRPAARGLQTTAPGLTATLRELPATAEDAEPALAAARAVAPTLDELGRVGAPIAARLRPTTRQLATFSDQADPGIAALHDSWPDILGVMEGWARSTAARDAAGHVFRLSVGAGPDLIAALAAAATPERANRPARSAPAPAQSQRSSDDRAPAGDQPGPASQTPLKPLLDRLPKLPRLQIPGVQLPDVDVPLQGEAGGTVNDLLDYLLRP